MSTLQVNDTVTGDPLLESADCGLARQWNYSFEISTLCFFVLPLVIISFLYVLIGIQLRRSSSAISAQSGGRGDQSPSHMTLTRNETQENLEQQNSTTSTNHYNSAAAKKKSSPPHKKILASKSKSAASLAPPGGNPENGGLLPHSAGQASSGGGGKQSAKKLIQRNASQSTIRHLAGSIYGAPSRASQAQASSRRSVIKMLGKYFFVIT